MAVTEPEPLVGPGTGLDAAVVALVVVLVLKFAALGSLAEPCAARLAMVPVLAHSTVPLLFLTTTYVRQNGIGTPLAENIPKTEAVIVVLATWLAPGVDR